MCLKFKEFLIQGKGTPLSLDPIPRSQRILAPPGKKGVTIKRLHSKKATIQKGYYKKASYASQCSCQLTNQELII